MTLQAWLLGFAFLAFFGIHVFLNVRMDEKPLERAEYALAWSGILTAVLSGVGAMQDGYVKIGLNGKVAWAITVIHLVVMLLAFLGATYYQRFSRSWLMHPNARWHSDRSKAKVKRLPRAWKIWRLITFVGAVVLIGAGVPDSSTWRAALADNAWIAPYFILWCLGSAVFHTILARTYDEPFTINETAISCGALVTLLVWALPLSRRGMEVLGFSSGWTWTVTLPLLLGLPMGRWPEPSSQPC